MKETALTKVSNCPICLKDSKIYINKGLVIIDIAEQGGTLWTCFYIIDNEDSTSHGGSAKKSYCF